MWLYVPSQYVPESGGSTSVSDWLTRGYEPFVLSKGISSPQPFSWRGWKNRPWTKLLSGIASTVCQSDLYSDVFTWSKEEFPVNPGPLQGSDWERMTPEICGRQPFDSLSSLGTPPCSSKTFLGFSLKDFDESSETLPNWGTMQNGVCSRTDKWVPAISATELSSWPTPTAARYGSNKAGSLAHPRPGEQPRPSLETLTKTWRTPQARYCRGETGSNRESPDLHRQISMWPTPMTSCYTGPNLRNRQGSPNIQTEVQFWPTPKARDWKQAGGNRKSPDLTTVCLSGPLDPTAPPGEGGQNDTGPRHLNVLFVERLMGFPTGWSAPQSLEPTAYTNWVTHSHHLLRAMRGSNLPKESGTD